jgi:hypothetical protein
MGRAKLHAVHDDDLGDVLRGLGLLEKFEAGHLKCRFCGDPVGWNNLHSLFPDSGDIKVVCNKSGCPEALLVHRTATRAKP